MAAHSKDPAWAGSSDVINQATIALRAAAQRMVYAELMPLVYRPWWLRPMPELKHPSDPTPAQCDQRNNLGIRDTPAGAWTSVTTGYAAAGRFGVTATPIKQTWALITEPITSPEPYPPPAMLTDPLAWPIGEQTREPNPSDDRDGLGLRLVQFLAQRFPAPTGKTSYPEDTLVCDQ